MSLAMGRGRAAALMAMVAWLLTSLEAGGVVFFDGKEHREGSSLAASAKDFFKYPSDDLQKKVKARLIERYQKFSQEVHHAAPHREEDSGKARSSSLVRFERQGGKAMTHPADPKADLAAENKKIESNNITKDVEAAQIAKQAEKLLEEKEESKLTQFSNIVTAMKSEVKEKWMTLPATKKKVIAGTVMDAPEMWEDFKEMDALEQMAMLMAATGNPQDAKEAEDLADAEEKKEDDRAAIAAAGRHAKPARAPPPLASKLTSPAAAAVP